MSAALRQTVSRLLLVALLFNALTPLIAAAQDRAGHGSILAFCTAIGLKQIEVSFDAQAPTTPAQHKNSCPFCLPGGGHAALPPALVALPALQPRSLPVIVALASAGPVSPHRLAAHPRGPPALL